MHFKNKSAGTLIPKLDLSKIKRDVDIEDTGKGQVEADEEDEMNEEFDP